MKQLLFLLYLTLFFQVEAQVYKDDSNCSATIKQTMKASSSYPGRQGYGVVNFDINTDGSVLNLKAVDSQCAISRNEDGSILFKQCPFFKLSSFAAGRYLKFSPPKNKDGISCMVKNQQHVFTYHKYRVRFDNPMEFLLTEDFPNFLDRDDTNKLQEPLFQNIPNPDAVQPPEPISPPGTSNMPPNG